MSSRFLILLLLISGAAKSVNEDGTGAGEKSSKKGDEIWLEEQISPTTRWLENLVKPITVWMEQQINNPSQGLETPEKASESSQESMNSHDNESRTGAIERPVSPISAEQATTLAKAYIGGGEVLYIKLMPNTNQYRVKLISLLGEVHIVYIMATSGEVVSAKDRERLESVKPIITKQLTEEEPVTDTGDDNRVTP